MSQQNLHMCILLALTFIDSKVCCRMVSSVYRRRATIVMLNSSTASFIASADTSQYPSIDDVTTHADDVTEAPTRK